MFSQLRKGNTIYILEKSETPPTLKVGQVVEEGKQVPKYKTPQIGQYGIQPEMVVDVTEVKVGEQTYKFEKLPVAASVYDYGNAIVSDNREAMLQEVETMRTQSQQVLDSVDYHKSVVSSVEDMLEELNPRYKEEKKRDAAIRDLSERFDDFEERIDKSLAGIEKLLSKAAK